MGYRNESIIVNLYHLFLTLYFIEMNCIDFLLLSLLSHDKYFHVPCSCTVDIKQFTHPWYFQGKKEIKNRRNYISCLLFFFTLNVITKNVPVEKKKKR